jgi:ankyrin repeat protein
LSTKRPLGTGLVVAIAFGIASSRCTSGRGCGAAPAAIESWSSDMHLRGMYGRRPNDHADLEAFLTKRPGAVNARYGPFCYTPLHSAAKLGREDIAPLLIKHGADLRARDDRGETPLRTAATFGRADVVTVLLASGADVNARGSAEESPLQGAVAGGANTMETRLEVARVLLAAGADINAKDTSGRTALVGAITMFSAMSVGPRNDDRMIELLLAHNADVRAQDSQGNPALVYAAETGNRKVVKLLLDRGADTNASGKDDAALGAALSSAAYGGFVEVAALLIDRGADVNWRYSGPLPLEWQALPLAMALTVARSEDKATMTRRREIALALITHGADVNARNVIRPPGQGETLLHAAAADGDLAAIELLLSHRATAAARDHAGFTPLYRAVQTGHVEAAARLLASGADANAAATDGTTALDLASNDREMEVLIRGHAKN